MRFLLDSCTTLWMMTAPERLSHRARTLVEDGRNSLSLSVVSVWEVAIKAGYGRLDLPATPDRFFREAIEAFSLTILPVTVDHALVAGSLPRHHRDPFDRMLVAQASVERLTLVSPDLAYSAYPVETIW